MNVLITGGREFNDLAMMFDVIAEIHVLYSIDYLVHGNARGADKLADKVADELGINRIAFPANWTKFKLGAGHIRNKSMIDMIPIDLVIAFPGNNGTANMKTQADKREIDVIEATDIMKEIATK